MGSRETLLLALAIASAFPFLYATGAATAAGPAWDIVVAFNNEIIFFKNDTEIREFTVANIEQITALAYDSVNRTLYISNGSDIRSDVVEENLDSKLTFDRILHTSEAVIWSMVLDPVTKTLFWVEGVALMKMEVESYGIDSALEILKLPAFERANELTLDVCHGFIYWTNQGDKGSSIERSRLDGTDREVIFTNEQPDHFHGLTVDHYGGKLYFGTTGGYLYTNIKIEKSNLDGTDRKVLVNSSYEKVGEPDRLAVDDTAVYWAQLFGTKPIWKVYKNGTWMRAIGKLYPPLDFVVQSNILTRHDVEGIDCKAVLAKGKIRTPEQLPAESQVTARLEQLSNKMDRLLTNQNRLLLALIGLLDDARLTHTAAISRIDALKPNLLDNARHPEN